MKREEQRAEDKVDNTGNMVVLALCLLGENDFQRSKTAREYADYIEQFYHIQAEANAKGYKFVVVVFDEASFNEYLDSKYGHKPVTEAEYAKARAEWAHWFVTSNEKRFGF